MKGFKHVFCAVSLGVCASAALSADSPARPTPHTNPGPAPRFKWGSVVWGQTTNGFRGGASITPFSGSDLVSVYVSHPANGAGWTSQERESKAPESLPVARAAVSGVSPLSGAPRYLAPTNGFCGEVRLRDAGGKDLPSLKPDTTSPQAYPGFLSWHALFRQAMDVPSVSHVVPGDHLFGLEAKAREAELASFRLQDYFLITNAGNYQLTIWPKVYARTGESDDLYKRIDLPPIFLTVRVDASGANKAATPIRAARAEDCRACSETNGIVFCLESALLRLPAPASLYITWALSNRSDRMVLLNRDGGPMNLPEEMEFFLSDAGNGRALIPVRDKPHWFKQTLPQPLKPGDCWSGTVNLSDLFGDTGHGAFVVRARCRLPVFALAGAREMGALATGVLLDTPSLPVVTGCAISELFPDAGAATNSHGLIAWLVAPKTNYVLGQRILLEAFVLNSSRQGLALCGNMLISGDRRAVRCLVTEKATGRVLSDIPRQDQEFLDRFSRETHIPAAFQGTVADTIAAKELKRFPLDLTRDFTLQRPGWYSIQVRMYPDRYSLKDTNQMDTLPLNIFIGR